MKSEKEASLNEVKDLTAQLQKQKVAAQLVQEQL
jgi:hypothetical protein